MNPHQQSWHNQHCRAHSRPGKGHIVIHSQKEQRYRCKRCSRTFSATRGTALYRMHKPKQLVLTVVTLLAYGCPVQAPSSPPSLSTNERWPVGTGRPAFSVGGCTSTSSRPDGPSFYRSRPTRSASKRSVGYSGWPVPGWR